MASRPLDADAITAILNKAGPDFLKAISIESMFMANLVQANVLTRIESKTIQNSSDKCDALLDHFYHASPAQFVNFCLVLYDKQDKQDFVTEVFGLDIHELRDHQAQASCQNTKNRCELNQPKHTSSSTSGAEVAIKIRIRDRKDIKELYSIFADVLSSDDISVMQFVIEVEESSRKILSKNSGCIVLEIYCPTLESLRELQNKCKSGTIANLVVNIFRNHPLFEEFNVQPNEVSVTMDDVEYKSCETKLLQQGQPGPPENFNVTSVPEPVSDSMPSFDTMGFDIYNDAPEDLVKRFTALTVKDIELYRKMGIVETMNKEEMKKIEETINKWTLDKYGPPNKEQRPKLNLVIMGQTGAGKSATGNLILGENKFTVSNLSESCTKCIEMGTCIIDGINVNVIDTPGFHDTRHPTEESILTEFSKIVDIFSDGIDGILFLFNMGNQRHTEEQKAAFKSMKKDAFDNQGIDNCFAVLTKMDTIQDLQSLSSHLERENKKRTPFADLLNIDLKKRVIGVNNADQTIYGRQLQRQNIIRMVLEKTEKAFLSKEFEKYQKHQQELKSKLPMNLRKHTSKFRTEVTKTLIPFSHEEIEAMKRTNFEGSDVPLEEVVQKMLMYEELRGLSEEDVKEGVLATFYHTSYPLVDPTFLARLGFMVAFAIAAGAVLIATVMEAPVAVVAGTAVAVAAVAEVPGAAAVGAEVIRGTWNTIRGFFY